MIIPGNFSESLETIFCVKNTLMGIRIRDLVDPGSGIQDGRKRIRDKHPGSAIPYWF
jgi:hypothetical protein